MTGETIGLIFAVGVVCAALYDFFRAAHTLMTRHTASVVISDVLFWLIITAGVIYSLWKINDIKVGFYETAALLTGAALYFMLASTFIYRLFLIFVRGLAIIFQYFFKILRYILKILLTPAQFLYKIIIMCNVVDRLKRGVLQNKAAKSEVSKCRRLKSKPKDT